MKKVQVEMYVTSDGKRFDDVEAASNHESEVKNDQLVSDFCLTLTDASDRTKARIKKNVLQFLAWQEMIKAQAPKKLKKAS